MPEEVSPAALAVQTEIAVVTSAIETSLGVRELTVEFAKRRDQLATAAYEFTKPPEDDDSQALILTAQRDVAKLRTELVKNSEALKGPLNNARTKIIDLTNAAVATLKKAEDHCAGLIAHRQQKLLEERRKIEAAAAAEQKRLADEQAAAQRAQQEAERQRLAAEIAAQQAELLKGKAKLKAQQDALDLATAATKAEEEAFLAGLAAETPAPVVAAPVSDLPMAREVIDFEIEGATDSQRKASLIKLLCAHPTLFSAHIKSESPRSFSLNLKVNDLTDALNGKEPFTKLESAPGITITKKLSSLR